MEKAPIVSQSDCTEMAVEETYSFHYDAATRKLNATITDVLITYNACTGVNEPNDLEDYYRRLVQNKEIKEEKLEIFSETVVGDNQCPSAIETFMAEYGWQRIPTAGEVEEPAV